MLVRFALLALFLSIGTAGCSTGKVHLEPLIVRPIVNPLPIAVGIHYADDLRNHECTGDKGYIAYSWTFALGPPSIETFSTIFTALFENVEMQDTNPNSTSAGDQRDIIELHLTEFTGCQASWPIIGTTVIEIEFKAIIMSVDGEELARWNGRGRAGPGDDLHGYPMSLPEAERDHLNALTSVAMRKALVDFVVNFENDPTVRAWAAE
jgi:hypothetical protein